jgi:hypothetical protein
LKVVLVSLSNTLGFSGSESALGSRFHTVVSVRLLAWS